MFNVIKFLKSKKTTDNICVSVLFFFTSLLLVLSICKSDINWNSNLFSYISNIESYAASLDFSAFKFFPSVIRDYTDNSYGFGVGIFDSSFSQLICAYIYRILTNFQFILDGKLYLVTMQIYYISVTFFSGLSMYLLTSCFYKSKIVGVLSSIIYMTFPYHFTNMFIQGALADSLFFVFIPLIFLGILYLIEGNHKKFILNFCIGYIGAMYSHLVMSVYFSILIVFFMLVNYKSWWNKKSITSIIIASITILVMTAPFWVPMLEHYFYGEYVVFGDGTMYDAEKFIDYGFHLKSYFTISNRTDNIQIFFYETVIILFITSIIMIKRIDKNKIMFVMYIVCFIMMIFAAVLIPWPKLPNILYSIQFPFRLNSFIALFVSFLSPAIILIFKDNNKQKIFIVVVLCLLSMNYLNSYDAFFKQQEISDSSELLPPYIELGNQKEYLTNKGLADFEVTINKTPQINVLDGSGSIIELEENFPDLKFQINNIDGDTLIEIPRFYYLGYKLRNIDNGNSYAVNEGENGLLNSVITESGVYELKYTGTTLALVTKFIRALYICGIILLVVYLKNKNKFVRR